MKEDITKFHFHISVRSNGTNVEFEECTDIVHKNCPSLDRYNLQKKNCKKDHECTRLDRIFRCEDGMCWNITNVYRLVATEIITTNILVKVPTCNLSRSYSCEWESKDPELDCENKRNCVELDGMYDCNDGSCGQIHNWTCERRCSDIDTPGKNVILMSGTLHRFIRFNSSFFAKYAVTVF